MSATMSLPVRVSYPEPENSRKGSYPGCDQINLGGRCPGGLQAPRAAVLEGHNDSAVNSVLSLNT